MTGNVLNYHCLYTCPLQRYLMCLIPSSDGGEDLGHGASGFIENGVDIAKLPVSVGNRVTLKLTDC